VRSRPPDCLRCPPRTVRAPSTSPTISPRIRLDQQAAGGHASTVIVPATGLTRVDSFRFKSTKIGDPRIPLSLLERVAGKATEKKDTGSTGALEKLIVELSTSATAPGATKSAAELAAEAKRKAEVRAALAAAKASP
jgi:hypothetical protein